LNWNRILSGLLALLYIIGASFAGGAEGAGKVAIFVILPLACIWFSDAMGGYVGPSGHGLITSPTPGIFVCIAGWLLLLFPLVVSLISALSHS